jgi:hypothetical protein
MLTPASHLRSLDVYNFDRNHFILLEEGYCSKFCISQLIAIIKDYILTHVT